MKGAAGSLTARYARSLFEAARDKDALPSVRRDLQAMHELWVEQPELKALLLNPGLSRRQVRTILASLAGKLELSEISRAFIDVLLDKGRLEIVADVQPVFERLMLAHEGKVEVKVTTAVSVGSELRRQIEQHLRQKSGKDPVVEWKQDPAMLGGIVIEWPDRVFDGSLARKLENMKAALAGSAV